MPAEELTSRQVLGVLYSDHHNWLRGWLRRRLGCAHQAADLAQDTFVRILIANAEPTEQNGMGGGGQALQIDTLREPRAYITTVAHGLMINYLKRRDLERAYLDALALQPEAVTPSPETRAIIIETLLKIDAMLDGLPVKTRQAFLLSQLEGLSYAEIGERLGVSVSMVKKYMLQAVIHCMRIEAA